MPDTVATLLARVAAEARKAGTPALPPRFVVVDLDRTVIAAPPAQAGTTAATPKPASSHRPTTHQE